MKSSLSTEISLMSVLPFHFYLPFLLMRSLFPDSEPQWMFRSTMTNLQVPNLLFDQMKAQAMVKTGRERRMSRWDILASCPSSRFLGLILQSFRRQFSEFVPSCAQNLSWPSLKFYTFLPESDDLPLFSNTYQSMTK